MQTNYLDRRKSGIALIGDVTWGTSFCHFYQTQEDQLEILGPFFKAGLENNEQCVWVTGDESNPESIKLNLARIVPDIDKFIGAGQLDIVLRKKGTRRGRKPEKTLLTRLDKAFTGGFDGVRLAFEFFSDKDRMVSYSRAIDEAVSRFNAIAVFSYPRDKFDAIGLMEVVKNHQVALIKNSGKWEVIESSGARVERNALSRAEEKLRALFSHMAEGFAYHRIVLDEKGKPCDYIFLEVNEAFEKILGIKSRDLIGKKVTQIIPGIEKDDSDWVGRYGEVALSGKPASFESYSDALKRWYAVSAFSPSRGFFAVTFSDVTERKRAEQALAKAKDELETKVKERTAQVLQERQRLFNVLETLPVMICLLTPDYHVAFANRSFRDAFGESQNRPCYEYCFGHKEPCDFCESYTVLETGRPHHWEVSAPNGKVIDAFDFPFIDIDGSPLILEMDIDITERKIAETKLQELNETLEQRVANRTVELESANKELESFSYSVSHDLRAPLRSMDGYSKALLDDYASKLDPQGKTWLQNIRTSSVYMGRLIDDILGLSRVIRTELKFEAVNLSDIACSESTRLKEVEPDREVEFLIKPAIEAFGDANLLGLVMQNLLGNAFKFTSKNPAARIEFGLFQQGGIPVYFVRDNGAGFDMRYVDKLFNAFQRLHTDKEYSGTGIGLATVQRIIQRHGGKVWAEGKVGRGATFYFTLSQEIE